MRRRWGHYYENAYKISRPDFQCISSVTSQLCSFHQNKMFSFGSWDILRQLISDAFWSILILLLSWATHSSTSDHVNSRWALLARITNHQSSSSLLSIFPPIVIFSVNRTVIAMVKVKLSLCLTKHHTMKTYWGGGVNSSTHSLTPPLGGGVVSFTPRPLYPQRKSSWYPLDRRLG